MLERSAIKKVKLPSNPALEQKILREVTIWGRLSHPGIVRYHTSWVETDTRSTDVKQALGMLTGSSEGSVVGTDSMEQSLSDVEESAEDDSSTTDGSGSEAGTISYENDEEIDLGFDDLDFMSTGHQSKSLSMPTIHFGNEDDPSNEPSRAVSRNRTPEASKRTTPQLTSPEHSRTLYIQMEVCASPHLFAACA
jgi:translation initiation factor 2-alpha kinase 4